MTRASDSTAAAFNSGFREESSANCGRPCRQCKLLHLPLGQGSAVVIGHETLVTNCHVLRKAQKVVVRRETISVDAKLDM